MKTSRDRKENFPNGTGLRRGQMRSGEMRAVGGILRSLGMSAKGGLEERSIVTRLGAFSLEGRTV